MNFNTVKMWTIGVSVLSVALLLGTILLGAKPLFDDAADLNATREDVEFQNERIQAEVVKLRAKEAALPATREAIAALQVGIPTMMNADELLLHVGELADKHDLTVAESIMDLPTSFLESAPTQEEAPAPEPDEEPGAEPTPVEPGEEKAPEAATTELQPVGQDLLKEFYIMDLDFTVQGTYADALAFVDELQLKSPRHFLAYSVNFEGFLEEKSGMNGLPDAEVGDVTMRIKGSAYVLQGIDQPEQDGDVAPEPDKKMPKPGANDNPFMPIEGQPAP